MTFSEVQEKIKDDIRPQDAVLGGTSVEMSL